MPYDLHFLAACLNLPGSRFTFREVARFHPRLRLDGILTRAEPVDAVLCPCGCGGMADIERYFDRTGGFNRVFLRCPESGELQPAESDDTFAWRFDDEAAIALLRRLLPCENPPECLIPGMLWALGPCETPIAGRRRELYYARNLSAEAKATDAALPQTSSPLLFLAANGIAGCAADNCTAGKFPRDRIFRLCDFLSVRDDGWHLDFRYLDGHVPRAKTAADAAQKAKRTSTRGAATLKTVTLELKRWIRLEYERYNSNNRCRTAFKLHPPTMENLAQVAGVNRSTVSDLLSITKHPADPNYAAVRLLWETAHDIDKICARCRRYKLK